MQKRYTVDLTPDECTQLIALTRKGRASARQVTRVHVLLHAADGMKDAEIAVAAHTSVPTVARIRKRFVQGRVAEAITERYRKGGRPKLDLKQEARLIALSCSTPPQGRKDWTMQLLADKLVEFHYTPKHASWLNMVEIELSILGRQCLDRRIPDAETLQQEVRAWEQGRNDQHATVSWHFTTADARQRLGRV